MFNGTPPRKNAIIPSNQGESKTQRTEHIKRIQNEGHFKWQRASGYYKQSHAENVFSRYKKIFGGRLHAKRDDSQEKETKIACSILNRMISLGSPDSYPVT